MTIVRIPLWLPSYIERYETILIPESDRHHLTYPPNPLPLVREGGMSVNEGGAFYLGSVSSEKEDMNST